MDPELFFRDHWEKLSIHINGPRNKFEGLFDRAAFDRVLPQATDLVAAYKDPRGWTVELPIQPTQAPKLFEAGMTICGRRLYGHAPLDAFLASFRKEIFNLGKPMFTGFHSPNGAGFGLHLDDNAVFILQIEGAKAWWYSAEPGVPNPSRGFQFPPGLKTLAVPWGTYTRPDESKFEHSVLEPGDVLYLPAGAWHRAEGRGSSLALTLDMLAARPADLLKRAFGEHVKESPKMKTFMSGFRAAEATPEQMPPELRVILGDALSTFQSFANGLTIDDLYAAWRAGASDEA